MANKNNEYSFWWSVSKGNTPFNTLNGEQQQAYLLLQNKVAMYGSGSLNRNGWGWSADVPTPYGGINEGTSASEPIMVSSLSKATSDYQLTTTKPLAGQPNLYMGTNQLGTNSYYFVVPEKIKPSTPIKSFMPPVGKTSKPPRAGNSTTYSGPTKPSKTAIPPIKEIPSQYDLLFNSLNYMSVGEAEIEKLSMDLIFAGDDLLTDFDYRSIDYLPDFEIETTNKYGDFVDVLSVYSNPAEPSAPKLNASAQSNLSEPKDLNNAITALITEMQKNLENQSFAKVSKYFGVASKTGFNTGYSKGDKIDFRYTLTDQFKHYDITIDFNLI